MFVGEVTSYTLHNLLPSTSYDVKVFAQYESGLSEPLVDQGTTRKTNDLPPPYINVDMRILVIAARRFCLLEFACSVEKIHFLKKCPVMLSFRETCHCPRNVQSLNHCGSF